METIMEMMLSLFLFAIGFTVIYLYLEFLFTFPISIPAITSLIFAYGLGELLLND